MKPFCLFIAMGAAVLAAGCSSAWPPAHEAASGSLSQQAPQRPHQQAPQQAPQQQPPHKPPVLSVGVSDPDTQLILPWFLADIVNAINTHQSAGDLMQTMKGGL
ncbi:hypothetical protein VOM14_21655 [Paraburkholderia sp. MPAMCS5]|uniref:hypothetical protein n=1 Tax=Paraburkholderia sp. MPAMCS5 TaxID=3112563 RepID=UPI002E19F45B|nr:hypothetical protein [Paraburkholderia sp. MPAMCS5]